jgi:hypothetical protein
MNRLPAELHRLFDLPAGPAGAGVRAMVLELARPADWEALAAVWRGVQADLELPAPAIAVNGRDGYQLWFSLAEPVAAPQAQAFLAALRERYLGTIAAARVGITLPAGDVLPPLQQPSGHWSAFVAPDLAPVFADEPWLDTPPNAEGQADLLARLQRIKRADFEATLGRLGPATAPAAPAPRTTAATQDPRSFLLAVMNDESVALGLRIEAAKALLHKS